MEAEQRNASKPTLKAEYANQLEEATNLFAQFDPVLAEAQQINWERPEGTATPPPMSQPRTPFKSG